MTTSAADPFVHLHVASGYSLQYGTASPGRLVQRGIDHGMDIVGLTDRDGLYGAVRMAKACLSAGIRPVIGVDLAMEDESSADPVPGGASGRRTPARGGATRDERHPRVVVLAQGRAGWGSLCRLVTDTHLAGLRGNPVSDRSTVGRHARTAHDRAGDLIVLLGTDSEVGRAVAARRPDRALALLRRWQALLPPGALAVTVTSHRAPGDGPAPGSTSHAARMLRLAREVGLPAVLTNAVRFLDRSDGPVADVLDASRRLVALDRRHVDRRNAEARFCSGKEMAEVAVEVVRAAGLDEGNAGQLLAATRAMGERCALDPRADIGLGEIHFPELEFMGGPGGGPGTHPGRPAFEILQERCEAGLVRQYGSAVAASPNHAVRRRLDDEMEVVRGLGYPSYFLTVADVCDLIRGMGVRVAARGSGAGSLICYTLGISGVDPMRYGLLMERFLSPLRQALPDIDVDVESARRAEVYERILDRYGGERVACVSMRDTYRIRHAIRDVGAALALPPVETDALAKAFPHLRARDIRAAMVELPELRASGITADRLEVLVALVERLDGLPRHVAVHPCGVLLSDATLLDRTPVETSFLGYPMSQFDKDDVEDLGLLKLDVLGIRMQSAMQHAVAEIRRVDGLDVDLDDQSQVALDDAETFGLIQSTRTLGCFQIESPGQRELVGKFAPETFDDLIVDISLFRPGPVSSDMVTPFLEARQGWKMPSYLHPDLEPVLRGTAGVVVFHEQVLQIVAVFTGCSLAEADEVRRGLGDREGKAEVREWFLPRARARGYDEAIVQRVWEVLEAFASFGFCKAHAAAFALPTFQSAWLKAHHPAAFLAGVLTHDPGMYPKRLILDDARNFGIAVLGLDVNRSDSQYRVERIGPERLGDRPEEEQECRRYGIRLALADVAGISGAEVARVVAGRPYASLTDFWHRARVSRPVAERLVLAGGFDAIYGIGSPRGLLPGVSATGGLAHPGRPVPVGGRPEARMTRRDLLLQVLDLDRWSRTVERSQRARGARGARGVKGPQPAMSHRAMPHPAMAQTGPQRTPEADPEGSQVGLTQAEARLAALLAPQPASVRERAAGQSQAGRPVDLCPPVQLALDLDDAPTEEPGSGLPELTDAERVRAELEILGLDASHHVLDFYAQFLADVGVTRSQDLRARRSRSDLLVAGVKVATQTPPIRSGRRVIFLTLDDSTGPIDATFFEDVQGPYAATVFHSWLLVVRGVLRRTGPKGVSIRATGAWELTGLFTTWQNGGRPAVQAVLDQASLDHAAGYWSTRAVAGAAGSRSTRPVMAPIPDDAPAAGGGGGAGDDCGAGGAGDNQDGPTAGGMRRKRVLVHPSGFRMSPYADVGPPGDDVSTVPRKLWHASPGSAGR